MAVEYYLKEDASGHYGLEDGSGSVLLESSTLASSVGRFVSTGIDDVKALGLATGYAVIFACALASGSVDDSRLTWGSRHAEQYDQQSTRAIFPPQVLRSTGAPPRFVSVGQQDYRDPPSLISASAATPPVVVAPLRSLYAAPQLADFTQSAVYWRPSPAPQGKVPATTLVPQQDYRDVLGFIEAPQQAPQGKVPATIIRGQQDYRDVLGFIEAPQQAPQGKVPASIIWGQQEYRDAPSSVRGPTTTPQGKVPSTVLVGPQEYRDAPSSVQASVLAPVTTPFSTPATVIVGPQDYRDPPSYIKGPTLTVQGPVPAPILIGQQEYRDGPSFYRAPQSAPQGKVPATVIRGQQEYRDSTASYKAPQPALQGPVPATLVVPGQTEPDRAPVIETPQAAAQGPVPALVIVPPQADPTQRAAVLWRSATIVIPNPVAPFYFVPEQESRYIPANLWPSTRASAALAFNPFIKVGEQPIPQWEQGVARWISPAAITQPVSGPLSPVYVWVGEQAEALSALTAQLQPHVWPAIQFGIVAPPVVTTPEPFSGGYKEGGWKHTVETAYERHLHRRRLEREREIEKALEAQEVAKDDPIQAELAKYLHDELARQAKHDDLLRMQKIVARQKIDRTLPDKVQKAFERAQSEATFSRLLALEREFLKMQEEEELALLLTLSLLH